MTERLIPILAILFAVIGLECAALHDAYIDHPMQPPEIHLPSNAQSALQSAAMDVSRHALPPTPRRHQ
jgi:hypothetical protein